MLHDLVDSESDLYSLAKNSFCKYNVHFKISLCFLEKILNYSHLASYQVLNLIPVYRSTLLFSHFSQENIWAAHDKMVYAGVYKWQNVILAQGQVNVHNVLVQRKFNLHQKGR